MSVENLRRVKLRSVVVISNTGCPLSSKLMFSSNIEQHRHGAVDAQLNQRMAFAEYMTRKEKEGLMVFCDRESHSMWSRMVFQQTELMVVCSCSTF